VSALPSRRYWSWPDSGSAPKQELDVAAVALLFLDDDVPSDEILRVIGAEECRDIGAEVVSRFGIQRQISQHV